MRHILRISKFLFSKTAHRAFVDVEEFRSNDDDSNFMIEKSMHDVKDIKSRHDGVHHHEAGIVKAVTTTFPTSFQVSWCAGLCFTNFSTAADTFS